MTNETVSAKLCVTSRPRPQDGGDDVVSDSVVYLFNRVRGWRRVVVEGTDVFLVATF